MPLTLRNTNEKHTRKPSATQLDEGGGHHPPTSTTLGRANGELLKKTTENSRIMLVQIA